MIGYAGSGYKGMQINGDEKTIESDLFKAFVAAGAISKANADDPKKSSLVRCARTDKGVHAAGNVISLKLIVEDPKIIQIINENLPPQIRVWGMERTNGSFSCYQSCDSRWYEYLIPTFSFLPPHPQSYLGKKLVESAEKEGVFETFKARQEDVASFWETTEDVYIKPILEKFDLETRAQIMATIHSEKDDSDVANLPKDEQKQEILVPVVEEPKIEPAATILESETTEPELKDSSETHEEADPPAPVLRALSPVELAIKEVKAAYITAKKAYRISNSRRERVQEALKCYIGTKNFHNYTIQKHASDPSAKRHIRSFNVQPEPVIINDTEWLSLKVHGQSFMMHQIRKMVAMAALVVRCGSPMSIIQESYGPTTISIPKAPGLGLLLEAPVFESYNERAVNEFKREKIDFSKYSKEMLEFKQREIYDRIFREEEKDHQYAPPDILETFANLPRFHDFFHHVDHYRTDYFLWVTASGLSAAKKDHARKGDASDDEADTNGEEG
jgi:tRNA pseudouridine38-40 synthase